MKRSEYICDRCGKTLYSRPNGEMRGIYEVKFLDSLRVVKMGDVCESCFNDFIDLASNFFDEVNREKSEDKAERAKSKPIAIYLGFCSHDCEAYYRCPVCGKGFGSWSINMKDVRCPRCKAELGGIK